MGLVQVAAVFLLLLLEVGAALLLAVRMYFVLRLMHLHQSYLGGLSKLLLDKKASLWRLHINPPPPPPLTSYSIKASFTCTSLRSSLSLRISQSNSGVIPIQIPFRCLNGSWIVIVFLLFNSAVLLDVLLISLPFSRLLRFNICVVQRPSSCRDRPCSCRVQRPFSFRDRPCVQRPSSFRDRPCSCRVQRPSSIRDRPCSALGL